jgi:RimJ/RimL family protein N-acetyltransferase
MEKLPVFETERLVLKPLTMSMAESYKTHFVDFDVIRQLSSSVPWPYPDNGVVEYFENVILPVQGITRWSWGLFLKLNLDEVIGSVDMWREEIPENRGFWLGQKFWGQGYMTEAVLPTLNYAFTKLNFERLIFSNAVGNLKSRRIKEKTGARWLGTRPAKFVDPSITEAETWELTKQEWQTHKLLFNLTNSK